MFFPCSSAKSTVIKEPLFLLASATNTPKDNPLIILFLAGKFIGFGFVPTTYSETINPPFFNNIII